MARGEGFGRWVVRGLALFGALLMVAGAFGWWLSTRVLEAEGFADVIAKTSQRVEVRDYIGNQASLRLAPTNNFVSAARPVVSDAISAAVATPPVEEAIRDFAQRAHEQVFQARGARRVDVNSQEAAVTIRSALQTINPALAKKLPANVLDTTTSISQSSTVDLLFRTSRWVEDLYLPVFLIGVGLMILAMVKARERVRAIRTVGVTLAVAGGLLLGVGFATPAFASVAGTDVDPLRGDAVASFISVLVGRLIGAGQLFFVVGLVLALAPGHDGGDLRHRATRVKAWFAEKRTHPRWRFAGGVGLMVLALAAVTVPLDLLRLAVLVAAILVLYVGVVVCLRAAGLMATDHSIPRLHKRDVFGAFAAVAVAAGLTAFVAVGIVAQNTSEPRANPSNQGCNGYIELCAQPLNQIVWPASHNAMSSAAYNFLGSEHTITIPEQLNAGTRFLMIDAYYGYDDDGLVRTNLAGGVDRDQLRKERGEESVRELDRLGALTGVADTSGEKQDIYFCHDFCELGAISAEQVFHDLDTFLDRNLTDVVVIDIEDYVQPKDLKQALIDNGLWDRVWKPSPKQVGWPSLYDMVATKTKAQEKVGERPRRLVVMSEKHPGVYPWLLGAYDVAQESPYTFTSTSQFNCNPNRGGTDKSFFILNHWLRPNGPPDPVAAAKVNSQKVLTARMQDCIATRGQLPNALAVDFTSVGDLQKTVRRYNAAVARQSGVTAIMDETVRQLRESGLETDNELNALRRLPKISEKEARRLLGPLADSMPTPRALVDFADPCPPGSIPDTRGNKKAAKNRKQQERANPSTTTSAATTTTTVAPDPTVDDATPDTPDTPVPASVPEGCVAL